jgi:hypothetical protein
VPPLRSVRKVTRREWINPGSCGPICSTQNESPQVPDLFPSARGQALVQSIDERSGGGEEDVVRRRPEGLGRELRQHVLAERLDELLLVAADVVKEDALHAKLQILVEPLPLLSEV